MSKNYRSPEGSRRQTQDKKFTPRFPHWLRRFVGICGIGAAVALTTSACKGETPPPAPPITNVLNPETTGGLIISIDGFSYVAPFFTEAEFATLSPEIQNVILANRSPEAVAFRAAYASLVEQGDSVTFVLCSDGRCNIHAATGLVSEEQLTGFGVALQEVRTLGASVVNSPEQINFWQGIVETSESIILGPHVCAAAGGTGPSCGALIVRAEYEALLINGLDTPASLAFVKGLEDRGLKITADFVVGRITASDAMTHSLVGAEQIFVMTGGQKPVLVTLFDHGLQKVIVKGGFFPGVGYVSFEGVDLATSAYMATLPKTLKVIQQNEVYAQTLRQTISELGLVEGQQFRNILVYDTPTGGRMSMGMFGGLDDFFGAQVTVAADATTEEFLAAMEFAISPQAYAAGHPNPGSNIIGYFSSKERLEAWIKRILDDPKTRAFLNNEKTGIVAGFVYNEKGLVYQAIVLKERGITMDQTIANLTALKARAAALEARVAANELFPGYKVLNDYFPGRVPVLVESEGKHFIYFVAKNETVEQIKRAMAASGRVLGKVIIIWTAYEGASEGLGAFTGINGEIFVTSSDHIYDSGREFGPTYIEALNQLSGSEGGEDTLAFYEYSISIAYLEAQHGWSQSISEVVDQLPLTNPEDHSCSVITLNRQGTMTIPLLNVDADTARTPIVTCVYDTPDQSIDGQTISKKMIFINSITGEQIMLVKFLGDEKWYFPATPQPPILTFEVLDATAYGRQIYVVFSTEFKPGDDGGVQEFRLVPIAFRYAEDVE